MLVCSALRWFFLRSRHLYLCKPVYGIVERVSLVFPSKIGCFLLRCHGIHQTMEKSINFRIDWCVACTCACGTWSEQFICSQFSAVDLKLEIPCWLILLVESSFPLPPSPKSPPVPLPRPIPSSMHEKILLARIVCRTENSHTNAIAYSPHRLITREPQQFRRTLQ